MNLLRVKNVWTVKVCWPDVLLVDTVSLKTFVKAKNWLKKARNLGASMGNTFGGGCLSSRDGTRQRQMNTSRKRQVKGWIFLTSNSNSRRPLSVMLVTTHFRHTFLFCSSRSSHRQLCRSRSRFCRNCGPSIQLKRLLSWDNVFMGKGKVFAGNAMGGAYVHIIYSVNGVLFASRLVREQDAFMESRRVDASIAEAAVFVNTLNYDTGVMFVKRSRQKEGDDEIANETCVSGGGI
jgi:hypothetical protein